MENHQKIAMEFQEEASRELIFLESLKTIKNFLYQRVPLVSFADDVTLK
jgi:hypothetical protein